MTTRVNRKSVFMRNNQTMVPTWCPDSDDGEEDEVNDNTLQPGVWSATGRPRVELGVAQATNSRRLKPPCTSYGSEEAGKTI